MALPFFEKRGKRKYLNFIFVIVILISALWFGQNYLIKSIPPPPAPSKEKKVEINLNILEAPIVQGLQPFEKISPFEGKIGRETPFLPYE